MTEQLRNPGAELLDKSLTEGMPTHECGIVGIWRPEGMRVAESLVRGIDRLQHRGTDTAGVTVIGDKVSGILKGAGMVREVFLDILNPDGSLTGNIIDGLPDARAGVSHVCATPLPGRVQMVSHMQKNSPLEACPNKSRKKAKSK